MASKNSKIKKDLDTIFSLYVRAKYADGWGSVKCYTCGLKYFWRTIQNGHFNPRSILAVRWDEDNCRPQCVGCNMFGRGKLPVFAERLAEELGKKKFKALMERSRSGNHPDMLKLVAKYKKKLKNELDKKGLSL